MAASRIPEESKKQAELTKWIEANKEGYVSHAVWQDNVEKVFVSGSLAPAEFQLRKDMKVSYERGGGFGQRGTTDISTMMAEFKTQDIRLPARLTLTNQMSILDALLFGFIAEDSYRVIINSAKEKAEVNETFFIQLRDGRDYQVTYDFLKDNNRCQISGIPKMQTHVLGLKSDYQETLSLLTRTYQCTEVPIQVAADALSESPVDKDLAKIWNAYTLLSLSHDHRALARKLNEYRSFQIFSSKLNRDIRCGYNAIWWSYGDVVVLRGNPQAILSIANKCNYDSDMELKLEDIKLKKDREAFLLQPFENGGEFFSLSLSDKDTIVIGPKNILSLYQEHASSKGIKIFFIEDMNKEQLAFFKVPIQLQPDKIAAIKKAQHVLSEIQNKHKLRFFSKWNQQAQHEKKQEADEEKIKNFRQKIDSRHLAHSFHQWRKETADVKEEQMKQNQSERCSVM